MKVTGDISEVFIEDISVCDKIIDFFEDPQRPKRLTGPQEYLDLHKGDSTVGRSECQPGRTCKDFTITVKDVENRPKCFFLMPFLQELHIRMREYEKKVNLQTFPVFLLEGFNIQKYTPPNDVYSQLHFEHSTKNEKLFRRMYTWCLYLNDIQEGGETLFPKQKLKVKPKKGKLVFFPAFFTHPHKGLKTPEVKYILTGWFSTLVQGETVEELVFAHDVLKLLDINTSFFIDSNFIGTLQHS